MPFVTLVALVCGCGQPTTARDPTDHPPLLQITSQGGPVLAAPGLYSIVWSGDEALGARMDSFYAGMFSSDYWSSRLGEYGVGSGEARGVTVFTGAVPASVDEKTLGKLVDAHSGADWPALAGDGAYVLFLPVAASTPDACAQSLGYHGESPSKRLPFAAVLQCPGTPVSETASHEAAEVATDPHPHGPRGYIVNGVEIADACVGSPYSLNGTPVARLYSNLVAARGDQDPCGPAPDARPFFNVALLPSSVAVHTDAQGNGTADLSIEPFAYGDVGPIDWQVVANYGAPVDGIAFAPASGRANAGDTIAVHLTVGFGAPFTTMPLTVYATAHTTWQNAWYGSLTIDSQP